MVPLRVSRAVAPDCPNLRPMADKKVPCDEEADAVNNDDEEDEDEEVEELAARKEANFFERFRVISQEAGISANVWQGRPAGAKVVHCCSQRSQFLRTIPGHFPGSRNICQCLARSTRRSQSCPLLPSRLSLRVELPENR